MSQGLLLIIVLITFLVSILISIIVFGVMFTMKKRLVMTVILPNKSLKTRSLRGDVKKVEKVGDASYFIDDKCFIKTFLGDKIFYYYGNPNPIDFNFDMNEKNIIGTKAQDIKSFQESDLVQKLFALDDYDKMILMICIGIALLCVVILVLQFGNHPVELSTKGNNTQIISDACRLGYRTAMGVN